MKINKFYFVAFLMILLLGCAGDDDKDKDNTAPTKPVLIRHLGDAGDGQIDYNGDPLVLTDLNNGIDAESASNSIRLMWEPLIYDDDLERINIYRFMNGDSENITKVDSLSAENSDYLDNSINDDYFVQSLFSYYIEVLDQTGNKTMSDTVSYKLLFKPDLRIPQNGSFIARTDTLKFEFYDTQIADRFRVILFDSDGNYQWSFDKSVANDGDIKTIEYTGGTLEPGDYSWRVDSFIFDNELGFNYGAESSVFSFRIIR